MVRENVELIIIIMDIDWIIDWKLVEEAHLGWIGKMFYAASQKIRIPEHSSIS
jgi:hypothetical protein